MDSPFFAVMKRLEEEGLLTREERERRVADLKAEIDADAQFAVSSPEPEANFAFGRVYAEDGGPGALPGPAWGPAGASRPADRAATSDRGSR